MKAPSPQQHPSLSRRSILKGGWTLGAAGVLGSFAPAAHAAATDKLKKGDVILFQGDSITDAGRKKDRAMANDSEALGKSYAAMIAGELLAEYPDLGLGRHSSHHPRPHPHAESMATSGRDLDLFPP